MIATTEKNSLHYEIFSLNLNDLNQYIYLKSLFIFHVLFFPQELF